ncbi:MULTISPECIES: tRNA (adenosine(37)-N6)-threonylcarbamoyltransferase complex dimerization subunit type 1 TsaB [Enterococcus]|uniref:tRNA (Adenosine(37)-N6)-threonylcarbamoyltransferase complex dimerization subunit type 1 TsaB n=1 Tax=Enterococcus alishanensis TaxID=1303817 RepID=A0ABS6TAL3_9ENTE|nr:tRNA (adenosine(37)-N6)-threonylcarbamoyltransferase complex dimerization subunit type 1 TsaB [Enterococcus alishanensis]MBV7389946.1 tRNA (adenosine(37)-N6)-threonylcarbamoyltransferase complex dimerization subunit type 1 TsaB [Enterococcus alishanensis]
MKVLAMDTSNQALTVAVVVDDQVIANFQLNKKTNHSLTLMPAIEAVMKASDLVPADLDRIVVAKGPGSYTGIRIAVTTAKTLAKTLDIELVGVSSLAGIAANILTDELIVPIFDARRNNVYAGIYQWQDNKLTNVLPDQHIPLPELLNKLQQKAIFVGEAEKFLSDIQTMIPDAKVTISQLNLPSGAVLAKLAEDFLPENNIDGFVPAYLKRVEAEEKWLATHEAGSDYVEKV